MKVVDFISSVLKIYSNQERLQAKKIIADLRRNFEQKKTAPNLTFDLNNFENIYCIDPNFFSWWIFPMGASHRIVLDKLFRYIYFPFKKCKKKKEEKMDKRIP